ncbi:MAG: hypothetical protein ACRYG7_15815 [Janthinobacterium lividum]
MLIKRHIASSGSIGVPTPSFTKGTIIVTLISFIERVIVSFQRNNSCSTVEIEDVISFHLALQFNDQARKESQFFLFDRQTPEKQPSGHTRSLDIGVFRSYSDTAPDVTRFFAIEAKRLPTPESSRRQEYVTGNVYGSLTGGIERFKHGVHGHGLPISSIIGYVQQNQTTHWPPEINSWIDGLILSSHDPRIEWHQDDKLIDQQQLNGDKVLKLVSNSKRIDNSFIQLIHYLILIED